MRLKTQLMAGLSEQTMWNTDGQEIPTSRKIGETWGTQHPASEGAVRLESENQKLKATPPRMERAESTR